MSIIHSFQAHSNIIRRIKQSPFNNAVGTSYIASCSNDKTVKIWNISFSFPFNWALIRTFSEHSSSIWALEWLDKDTLASSGELNNTINLWSLSTGQTKQTIITQYVVLCLKLLNNKIHLAAGVGTFINVYSIKDGTLVSTLTGHATTVFDLVQLSDELLASSGGNDLTIRIWNLTTNTTKFVLTGHTLQVTGLKQIDSEILASSSLDKTIKLWNLTSGGELIRTLSNHTNSMYYSIDLINNGDQASALVSGSLDQTIKLWNRSTGECFSTKQTPGSFIISLAVINLFQQTTKLKGNFLQV
jgi:WD40 repeat protein